MDKRKTEKPCRGCGRLEMHKMCPAWGTPIYMTGQYFTKEMEEQYRPMRQAAIEEAERKAKENGPMWD